MRLMNNTLHYLYDPLCGWCYGATPAIDALIEASGVAVELLPTGLFSGPGARLMDESFAAFAWSNDQRIARATGQLFSDDYRQKVLAHRERLFDSGPATLALAAVSVSEPERERQALKAIQRARYVDGADVTSTATLVRLLEEAGLGKSAEKLAHPDQDLHAANQERIGKAQLLMRRMGARGVPTLIFKSNEELKLLNTAALFSNPPDVEALTRQLNVG